MKRFGAVFRVRPPNHVQNLQTNLLTIALNGKGQPLTPSQMLERPTFTIWSSFIYIS